MDHIWVILDNDILKFYNKFKKANHNKEDYKYMVHKANICKSHVLKKICDFAMSLNLQNNLLIIFIICVFI